MLNLIGLSVFGSLYFQSDGPTYASNPTKIFIGGSVYKVSDLEKIGKEDNGGDFGVHEFGNGKKFKDYVLLAGKNGQLLSEDGNIDVIIIPKIRAETEILWLFIGVFIFNVVILNLLFLKLNAAQQGDAPEPASPAR